jgi:hypothetical protein
MTTKHSASFLVALAILAGTTQLARSAQQCQAYGPPIKRIQYLTLIQDWCDPGNRNLLQVDLFYKQSNGSKGGYISSDTNILCSDRNVPSSVRSYLC